MIIPLSAYPGQVSPDFLPVCAETAAADAAALRRLCVHQQTVLTHIAQAIAPCEEALDLLDREVGSPSLGWPTAVLRGACRTILTLCQKEIRHG